MEFLTVAVFRTGRELQIQVPWFSPAQNTQKTHPVCSGCDVICCLLTGLQFLYGHFIAAKKGDMSGNLRHIFMRGVIAPGGIFNHSAFGLD